MTVLETKELKKYYGSGDTQVKALDGVDLTVENGEFVAIVGTSGSGKSTLLHMLGGLDRPTGGSVLVEGRDIFALKDEELTIFRRRKIGFVFQSYNLVPVLSVYDNIVLPIQLDGGRVDETYVDQVIEALGLEQMLDRLPNQLSGGQQQRVALARAVVIEPSVLLFDEPLSNLDAKLRNQMRAEIIKLRQRINTTFIYVTHDQTEAMTLGDRIVIMKDGFIQQIGTPQEVFDQPANLFVAGFIGSPQMNFFDGQLSKKDGKYQIQVGEAAIVLADEAQERLSQRGAGDQAVVVGIRPEHISFATTPGSHTIASKVDVSEMMGSEVYLHVNAVGRDVVLRIPTVELPAEHRSGIPYGTDIHFTFRPELVHLFDPQTEKNLMY